MVPDMHAKGVVLLTSSIWKIAKQVVKGLRSFVSLDEKY
jgi:hypothetical protein